MAHVPGVAQREVFNRTVHGARGLFAGIVLVYHVVNSGLPTWPILLFFPVQFVLRTAEYGVELFFCISGFVIVGTLRRARNPLAFMEDRLIRIYPVLWATILVILGLALASGSFGYDTIPKKTMAWLLPANLLGLPGIFPWWNFHPAAWTLSYELAFYGACAVVWAARRRLGLWPSLLLGVPVGACMITLYPRGIFFLAGVAVALGVIRLRPVAILARWPLLFLMIFLLLWREIENLSLPGYLIDTTLLQLAGDRRGPLTLLAFAAATVGFAGIVAENGAFSRMLRSPAMQFMGTISYSFYLWHPIIMSILKQAMLRGGVVEMAGQTSQLLFLCVSLPPAVLVGWLSQRILERGAGSWLRRRLHHRASLVAQASSLPDPHTVPDSPPRAAGSAAKPRAIRTATATAKMAPDAGSAGRAG